MNVVGSVFEYWRYKEYLNPLSTGDLRKDKGGKKQKVMFDWGKDSLPWLGGSDVPHTVFLGKVEIETVARIAYEALEKPDKRIEKETGDTCLCSFDVDGNGNYCEETFNIVPLCYVIFMLRREGASEDKKGYAFSDEKIKAFNQKFDEILGAQGDGPLDWARLDEFFGKVKGTLKMGQGECEKVLYALKNDPDNEEDNDNAILPSFYAKDIEAVKKAVASDKHSQVKDKCYRFASSVLKDYKVEGQRRVDDDPETMLKLLDPALYPVGKWPSKFQPSLMQQIAVNCASQLFDQNAPNDVFSVNGPPGTGKTTLLKEIVADVVVRRAGDLAKLNPASCCKRHELENPPDEKNFLRWYYSFPEELDKYSILVASNNNAAVENISMDLPRAADVSEEKTLTGLFDRKLGDGDDEKREVYFSDVATECIGDDAWGLISLRLGNRKNIGVAKKALDNLLRPGGLLHKDSEKLNWKRTVSEFEKQYKLVEGMKGELARAYEALRCQEAGEVARLRTQMEGLKEERERADALYRQHLPLAAAAEARLAQSQQELRQMEESKPKFGLFGRREKESEYRTALKQKQVQVADARSSCDAACACRDDALKRRDSIEGRIRKISAKLDTLERDRATLDGLKGEGAVIPDSAFFDDITRNADSQTKCPWATREFDEQRERLFFDALMVHKAFAQNSKLGQNIRMLIACWDNQFASEVRAKVMRSVFPSLFLLSPVVSTTFASVQSMLKDFQGDSFGLLIVDEAGQATPQSSLGALWRCRKAVYVGDPLQVEPVNPEIEALTPLLQEKFAIPKGTMLNGQSAQECADKLNLFVGKIGSTEVGCPLVVHRRCISPMFDISNQVSYDGRMIPCTGQPSAGKQFLLDESCWVDIQGTEASKKNHYVKEQGECVLELLEKAYGMFGNDLFVPEKKLIFIITPFVSVKNGLIRDVGKAFEKRVVGAPYSSDPSDSDGSVMDEKKFKDNLRGIIGTVHTFQGKEANEVLFVLGCDNVSGTGAANWAGSKPNILNVAATRAKYRLATIGDKSLWKKVPNFNEAIGLL